MPRSQALHWRRCRSRSHVSTFSPVASGRCSPSPRRQRWACFSTSPTGNRSLPSCAHSSTMRATSRRPAGTARTRANEPSAEPVLGDVDQDGYNEYAIRLATTNTRSDPRTFRLERRPLRQPVARDLREGLLKATGLRRRGEMQDAPLRVAGVDYVSSVAQQKYAQARGAPIQRQKRGATSCVAARWSVLPHEPSDGALPSRSSFNCCSAPA